MRRLVIALALVLAAPAPTNTASIDVDQPGPYAHGDTITLTVEVPKLKGYEYPVVTLHCLDDLGRSMWTYFRRWDTEGPLYPWGSGPEPVLLGGNPAATNLWNQEGGDVTCTVRLWAYPGLTPGKFQRLLASDDDIFVTRPVLP